jgi:catechol 2,3-dioxygenase-like lactoylglutathione lyase family enzyme
MSGSIYLSRLVLVSADPQQLARFYVDALGFTILPPDTAAHGLRLKLGAQEIEIEAFDPPGQPYPPKVSGLNTLFQHFAIVVSDIDQAYQRLRPHPAWMPISLLGPERLPESSGGVSAYKFRDPEGHPLELLAFPLDRKPKAWSSPPEDRIFLGIDHSAISVADTKKSRMFYESLGLSVGGGSFNEGSAQVRLDAIDDAAVEVTSLILPEDHAPHVELLCYRASPKEVVVQNMQPEVNDIAATRLVFAIVDMEMLAEICAMHRDAVLIAPSLNGNAVIQALLRDPDGHLIQLEATRNEI